MAPWLCHLASLPAQVIGGPTNPLTPEGGRTHPSTCPFSPFSTCTPSHPQILLPSFLPWSGPFSEGLSQSDSLTHDRIGENVGRRALITKAQLYNPLHISSIVWSERLLLNPPSSGEGKLKQTATKNYSAMLRFKLRPHSWILLKESLLSPLWTWVLDRILSGLCHCHHHHRPVTFTKSLAWAGALTKCFLCVFSPWSS